MDNDVFKKHFAELLAGGFKACEHLENGQTYLEVRNLSIGSPPWNKNKVNVLVAVPSNYNMAGLDAFYFEDGLCLSNQQAHPRAPNLHTILKRQWRLVSWHYNKPWSSSDTLLTHVQHCNQFFKQGARSN